MSSVLKSTVNGGGGGGFLSYSVKVCTKNALECALECLHTLSLKTSPASSVCIKKCDPVRYTNRIFQKLESVLYRIAMFTHDANQYNVWSH